MSALTAIEPKLKEILYNCLEQIRATKSALYLSGEEKDFDLVAQYGFRDAARKSVPHSDEMVERMMMKRGPFFVNGMGTDPKFSELLYASDTTRLLAAPIFSRGKMIGFVDMRDKAGQQPFENADLEASQKITDQFLDLLAEEGLFGLQKVAATPAQPASVVSKASLIEDPAELKISGAAKTVEEARAFLSRGGLRPKAQTQTVSERQLEAGAVVLPALLSLPGVIIASLSAFSSLGGHQIIAGRSTLTEETLASFLGKLRTWLQKRNEPDRVTNTSTIYPFGTAGPPIDPSRIISTLSAPVRVQNIAGVVLSIGFEMNPAPETKTTLEKFLSQVEEVLGYALANDRLIGTNQRIAERLVEPDLRKFPHLAAHSQRVGDLAERLATFVGVTGEDLERIRLAALVHDVGMRLLDYEVLYRKETPTNDDLKLLRDHVIVGAALVADSPLGPEIAQLVMSHHERFDGTGYPSGVAGEDIPLGARIIHLCESFDAMTAPDSYQQPVPPAAAIAKIRRAAGSQFDPVLAEKFIELMSKG